MKTICTILFISISAVLNAQVSFEKYFSDKTLRFDFMFAGNYSKTTVYPVALKSEPTFAGSLVNLTDNFGYGSYMYEVYDGMTNTLIYSRGFCSLYQEWQTTDEAKKTERAFYEVATMPYPKNKIIFRLKERKINGQFSELYETVIDPADINILHEPPSEVATTEIIHSGDPHMSVDIAFIAEGYTLSEMNKFRKDVARLSTELLSAAPFGDFRNKINIWAVEAVSDDSGTDVPGEGIYVNSALNSGFNTFGMDRYLTSTDIRSINDYAASVPHDNIVVLINSRLYGGGGVYNYYTGVTSDNALSSHVFIHEFGHSFAGLADEYYTSDVTYNDYYPLTVEPWEPNITTLVNFESKWKSLLYPGIPVPTPDIPEYRNKTGLFEGGGYSSKGIFRSESECRMKTNATDEFCDVCRIAIEKMAEFYTK